MTGVATIVFLAFLVGQAVDIKDSILLEKDIPARKEKLEEIDRFIRVLKDIDRFKNIPTKKLRRRLMLLKGVKPRTPLQKSISNIAIAYLLYLIASRTL